MPLCYDLFSYHLIYAALNRFYIKPLGRIPLKNLDHTSLENIHAYIDKEVTKKPRMRNQNSEQVWLWHDDDELLQYEGLLEDYHER